MLIAAHKHGVGAKRFLQPLRVYAFQGVFDAVTTGTGGKIGTVPAA